MSDQALSAARRPEARESYTSEIVRGHNCAPVVHDEYPAFVIQRGIPRTARVRPLITEIGCLITLL